nr:hypothetical protein BaRGS_001821 [Batillaria attramentaria]
MAGSAVRTADVRHIPRNLTDDRLFFDFLMNRQPHSKKPSRLSTYQFTNCGDPNKELVLAKLTLSPDPLPSSGTINITFQANISKDVVAPVKGNYSLPGVSLDVDLGILPTGAYRAKFDFEASAGPVGCYEIRFNLD